MALKVNIDITNLIICEHCGAVFCGDMINLKRDAEGLWWFCIVCKTRNFEEDDRDKKNSHSETKEEE